MILTTDDIQKTLKKYPVEFVVANIGEKLKWISYDKSFDFWKPQIIPHLANDIANFNLYNFLENYAHIASEWIGEFETPIILLEKISLGLAEKVIKAILIPYQFYTKSRGKFYLARKITPHYSSNLCEHSCLYPSIISLYVPQNNHAVLGLD